MKTIGLIGGITWVSTIEYYRFINSEVNNRAGGNNSAKIILHSVNFGEFKQLADEDKWDEIALRLEAIAGKLKDDGADFVIICSNTPHKVANKINFKIPFIHIADVTAEEVRKSKISKVALLGTKFTMQEDFYKEKMRERNIETIIPDADDMEFIHSSIFTELAKDIFTEATKNKYITIINKLIEKGAQGVILGCTEIPLLIKQEDSTVPVFDTTIIHATAAVDCALG